MNILDGWKYKREVHNTEMTDIIFSVASLKWWWFEMFQIVKLSNLNIFDRILVFLADDAISHER